MSQLTVIKTDRSRQPFMRGILTHKLMTRGLNFSKSLKIAQDAKTCFLDSGEVTSRELSKKVNELIIKRFGKEELESLMAENYRVGVIQVKKKHSTVPFSKLLLAQSVTAAGLSPEVANRISFDIENQLRAADIKVIAKDDLFDRITDRIEKEFGSHTAGLYRLASRLDTLDRPLVIYISGAPGTGKSVMATALSALLGINKVIGTDSIREIMRLAFSGDLIPTLYQSTTEAWKGLPLELKTREQLITGFCLQSDQVSLGVKAVVERTVEEGASLIIEGVHLIPFIREIRSGNAPKAYHIPLALSVLDTNQHRNRFKERGAKNHRKIEKFYLERFNEIRDIHDFSLEQFEGDDIEILNNDDYDATLNTMVKYVIQHVQMQVDAQNAGVRNG